MPTAIAVVALLGAGLLLFPTVVSWFAQYEQSQRIHAMSDDVADLGAATLGDVLQEARDYNAALTGSGANIAANERLPIAASPDGGRGYESILRADEDGSMGRLRIPAIDVDLPISHGTSTTVLEHGVGHLEGTALPVGGASTHSVLTAHRGLATAVMFDHLDRVGLGDTFTLEVFGEVLTYRVRDTRIVAPTETESLLPVAGEDLVTLVTCTPLGVNSHRILVTGERVIPTPQSDLDGAGERPDIPAFPWWALIAGSVVLVAGAYVWWSGRPPRPGAPPPTGATAGSERDTPGFATLPDPA